MVSTWRIASEVVVLLLEDSRLIPRSPEWILDSPLGRFGISG